ncbi:CoA pyrophosphatase [Alteromonadaceae bacterium BrNp21-10]|nr:CoA pyrophosphatase [Alteromonadaceae bacterium BrNp21-10]
MNRQQFLSRFYHQQSRFTEADFPLRKTGSAAAVLIPIVIREELQLLLTHRALHLKHHPGQISFPGGRWETTDKSLEHTALRETQEEIGLDAHHIEVIGKLSQFRTISGYEITPYIGLVTPPFTLQADSNEVADIFEVPLAHVLNIDNHHIHWSERQNKRYPVYFIPWQQQMIWGATAAIIRNLSHVIHH